ncbi:CAAX prenyl protease 1 [Irineochytrium annulatum]|nr:CAAX prenyl protease 1 [Irineochytrium annulatum]
MESYLDVARAAGRDLRANAADLLSQAFPASDGTGIDYKSLVLAISWTIFAWDQYLNFRQWRNLANKELGVPKLLTTLVSKEEHAKSKAYGKEKQEFGFVVGLFSQLQTVFVITFNFMPWLWKESKVFLDHVGLTGDREIMQSIVFIAIYIMLSTVINIPFSLYSTFVVEARHGFNKQTLPLFFSDMVKEILIGIVLTIPLVSGFVNIVKWGGDNFFFYVWLFMGTFQVTMLIIYPNFIQPLFNKFTPLPEGPLKEKIKLLANRLRFPLSKIFVVDGSKRSSHSNAYFIGLFREKRIVLFDTLLEQTSEDEIIGILAHELGHWQMNHLPRRLAMVQIQLFLIFYLFSHFVRSPAFFSSFGFDTQPIMVGIILFMYLYQPLDSIASFLMNVSSRAHEFEADAYAKKLGYKEVLSSGLIKISQKNLGNLNPDHLYSAWHHSHPGLVERLEALKKGEDKSQ